MSKKIVSMILALAMVFSLAAPVISASASEAVAPVMGDETSDLRVGILSDIHVSYDYVDDVYGNVTGHFNGVQPIRFEKALRFFKANGVDAVVIAGDLQESNGTSAADLDKQKDWMQTVVDIWFEVFPEKPGEEGYVEPIVIYGNHDAALVTAQYWPEEWGTYEDAFIKTVNGYSFVCAHNAKENLAVPLLEKVAPNCADKPLFYIQHCPVNNTVPGSTGGYGVGYGQTGRANLAPYPNAVCFNGHTHAPLTDEKSIWQGDAGNEGQFTVINTATINYTGLANDDMSVNSYAGNPQQTEHAMIMNVSGSQVSVDRYSLNDMAFDTATNTISGEAVKIGETWSWDACDVTDRPYAYDSRYANAHAPVFADDAAMTINSITDTSVSVSIPAASLTAPAGFSDMIEGYVVEACNPTSGEVEATGRVATSYHVDDQADIYEASYTVTVNGLKPGTAYVLKGYAQELFDKRSQALTAEITTTGTLASYRRGDVNEDGMIDAADMEALTAILAKPGDYIAAADIDMNTILEMRDIVELQAILDGKKITYNTGDLMDLVTSVKLTGASTKAEYQPVDFGTIIQNQVVRGDSNQAVKTWTTNYAYYPVTTMYFDEPVDLSGYTHLSFDTLFENEYTVSSAYQKRWLSVSFISGEQEQIASYGSMNFDPNGEGWTTKTVSLAALKNIDLTAVTGIRFSHNFDYYEGRYDGVTEHAIYWDNIYGVVIEGNDGDMLNGATVSGGNIVFGAGYTNNTNQAIQSTGGTLDYTFETPKVMTDFAGVKVDIRTPVTTTVMVQALDADGNLLGNAVAINGCNVYRAVNISVSAMGLAEGTVVSGLRFTYTCDSLLLDNMFLQGSKDYDLIGTASSFTALGGSNCTSMITTEGGNGSNNALYASAAPGTSVWSGGAELTYDVPLDLSETPYLRFDMKVQNAHWAFTVVLYNSKGEEIWRTLHYNATSSGGQYATYEFDLRSYRTHTSETGYVSHEVTAEQLKDVAKISLTADLASNPKWMTSDDTALREVWFDNLVACNPVEDFFGADTGLIAPSKVQDSFVCEILPSTDDGHTDVLHWYSNPDKNSGTTDNWPGETYVSFTKNVNMMNHNGYTGSYDYLEFDIKTVGMYIAMYLTVLDANGATLGSTGEYRISYEQEWSTFRVDASALGMSAEDFTKIAQVKIGWNWQHQNVNGTADKYVADIYIDNMGLRSIPTESNDLLDQLTWVRNQDWWTGGNGKFTGGGWKFQSDVTAESDKALMFYRSETSQNISYGSKTLYMYFLEPLTLDAKWSLEIDAIKHNYNASGAKVQIIASDGKNYDLFAFTHKEAGVHTYSTLVSSIAGFDAATMTVTGLYFTYPMNPDSSMDKAADGYMVLDNLNISIPEPMDEDDFLHTATCEIGQNQTAVTNNSLSAWKITPTNIGWNYPQFVLSEACDISNSKLVFDLKVVNMKQYRMHIAYINGTWNSVGTAAYTDVSDGWITVEYDLSANTQGVTEMTAFSFGFDVVADESMTDYAFYIDNVKLVDKTVEPDPTDPPATEPEPTEPEPTEPEPTEPTDPPVSPNPEDPGDLLGATNSISYNKDHWDNLTENGTGLIGVVDTENVYGDASTRSWSFQATAAASREAVAQMAMPYIYDMTGKMLVFDVKFDCADTSKTLVLRTRLHETGSWADVTTNISKTLKPGYWQTVALDFTNNIISGKDLSSVQFITFTMDFASNTGVERAFYIDNLRLVDIETIEDDLIHCRVDSGNSGNRYWISDEYTYGDSSFSMRVENQTSGVNDIYYNSESQYGKDNLPNFDHKIVSAYFYFGDQTPYATFQVVDKNWSGVQAAAFGFESLGDGWYLGQVNTSSIITHSATTDMSECIRFSININSGAVVYVDGLTILPGETVEQDWINIPLDTGSTKGTYGPNTEYTYGDDSAVSMRYEPTGGSYINFHTQSEVNPKGGSWETYPDMRKGTFSADIYFGDQTPSVKLQLTDLNWKSSTSTAMKLEDLGDGWYHASLDVASLTVPAGFDATQIIRIYLTFTAGQKVYIDNMKLIPPPEPYVFDGLDIIGAAESVTISNADLVESGFVFETLEAVDGHSNVIHMYSDPANGGGYASTSNYYLGANIKLPTDADYEISGIDYIELKMKSTNLYADNYHIAILNANGSVLGSTYKRMAMTSDWASYRLDLNTLGVTAEELATIASIQIKANWSKQVAGVDTSVVGELYLDDLTFGCYVDDSTDMFDHIASIQNVEWWWSGNNTYGGVGWLLGEDAEGNAAFTLYRKTETNAGAGYTPRRQYLYFDSPMTITADTLISIDVTNTYMGTSSKISFLGSDGKKYGYLKLDKTGTNHYSIDASDLKLLNSDTHMTESATMIDVSAVTIIGVIMHNDFFNGDKTYEGTLVMDNFVFGIKSNPLDDMMAGYTSFKKPTAVEEGFVCEILDETDDGYANVVHWYSDPSNGSGTKSNAPGATYVYISDVPSYVDTTAYDYLEFTYKHVGTHHDIALYFFDASGTLLGQTGTIRAAYGTGWATYRVDLDTVGLTAEEIKQISYFAIDGFSWKYQNVSATDKRVADMYVANVHFGCVSENTTDLIGQVTATTQGSYAAINNSGYGVKLVNGTNDSVNSFTISRGAGQTSWLNYTMTFNEGITVDSDWVFSVDFIWNNFHHDPTFQLVDSNGNKYTVAKPNAAVSKSISITMESAGISAGTVITGIYISYSAGASNKVNDTVGGSITFSNVLLTDPSAE